MLYKQSDLQNSVWDPLVYPSITNQLSVQDVMNFAVREVFAVVDLRSAKRLYTLPVGLFDDIYDYPCPTDLKNLGIIDVVPQVRRSRSFGMTLVGSEEFDQKKSYIKNLISFNDHDLLRKLRISVFVDSDAMVISQLSTILDGSGNWTTVGDATNLRQDNYNYVRGNASLEYDIGSGGTTTAGIVNSTLNVFDITNYVTVGSIFVYVYLSDATNISNLVLNIGNDSSNYYSMTATTNNEGVTLYEGWNLVRFDFSGATLTGTVTENECKYAEIYMTKTTGKISQTDFRFNYMVMERGTINNLLYYTKYGWQDSSGNYKENSTTSTDTLVCDTDEYDLIVKRTRMEGDRRLKDINALTLDTQDFNQAVMEYRLRYPSEALMFDQTYHEFRDQVLGGSNVDQPLDNETEDNYY